MGVTTGMAKLIDLTGKTFGCLTVLRRVEGVQPATWVCRCSCGAEHTALGGNLRKGVTTRCPKCSREKRIENLRTLEHPGEDITGQRFSRLTAVEYCREKGKWLCRCDCGGSIYAVITYLRSGRTWNCGCMENEGLKKMQQHTAKIQRVGTDPDKLKAIMSGKLSSTNTTGVTGVVKRMDAYGHTSYHATIRVQGKSYDLGTYDRFDDAVNARKVAEWKYFAPFVDTDKAIKAAIPQGNRRKRVCKNCAKIYSGRSQSFCSETCLRSWYGREQDKINATPEDRPNYVWKTCIDCGARAYVSRRSMRCLACQQIATLSSLKASFARAKDGTMRKFGSTSFCEMCGVQYTVASALQKYCSKCAQDVKRERCRAFYIAHRDAATANPSKREPLMRICDLCGSEFFAPTMQRKNCDACIADNRRKYNHQYYLKKTKIKRKVKKDENHA